jgi:hypothetical protein
MSETSVKGNVKHTPGPWKVESDGMAIALGGEVITSRFAPENAYADEARANARLIAAAPELLNALRRLINDNSSEARLAGLAAITKAEGGAA